jgi:hypothetical protein
MTRTWRDRCDELTVGDYVGGTEYVVAYSLGACAMLVDGSLAVVIALAYMCIVIGYNCGRHRQTE